MLYIVMLVAYLAIVVIVGLVSKRNQDATTKQHFIANGSMGIALLLPMVLGETIAGSGTTGTATGGFTSGFTGIHAQLGLAFGGMFVAIFLAKFFMVAGKAGAMSGPETFRLRFGEHVHMAVLIITFIVMLIMCAVQPKALASLVAPILGISIEAATWIIGLLFLVMALAGIRGIAKMNIVNCIVLFVGLAVTSFACVNEAGGLQHVLSAVPEHYLSFANTGVATLIASVLGSTLGVGVSGGPINVCLSAKSRKDANVALFGASIICIIFSFLVILVGMAGYVVMPGAVPASILFTMPDSVSPVLSAITVLAVAAAVMSTGPFFLLYISTVAVRDFVVPFTKIQDDAQQLRLAKVIMAICCILSIILANYGETILGMIMGAMQIQSVEAIVLLVGLVWPRMTNKAAFWAILIGGLTAAVWYFLGAPFGIAPFWVGTPVTIICLVVISLANRQSVSDDFRHYREWREAIEAQE